MSAITGDALASAIEQADRLRKSIRADRVQFLLNENGQWEFNYMTTDDGQVVGTPASFARRQEALELVMEETKQRGTDHTQSLSSTGRVRESSSGEPPADPPDAEAEADRSSKRPSDPVRE